MLSALQCCTVSVYCSLIAKEGRLAISVSFGKDYKVHALVKMATRIEREQIVHLGPFIAMNTKIIEMDYK